MNLHITTGYSYDKALGLPRRGGVQVLDWRFKGANRKFKARMEIFGEHRARIWSTHVEIFSTEQEAQEAVIKFLNYQE